MAKKQSNPDEIKVSFEVQNPKKYSIAIAVIWLFVMIIISIIGFVLNHRNYVWNINAASLVTLIISFIWSMLKVGVLEKSLYKLKKHKEKSFSQKHKVDVEDITMEEYTRRREKKSWWGIIILSSISILLFVITTIIQQL